MDARSPESRELLELLNAVCDGRGDDSAYARIDALLCSDESAADTVVAFSYLHTDLWREASSLHAQKLLQDVLNPVMELSRPSSAIKMTPNSLYHAAPRLRRAKWFTIALSVAAVLVFAMFIGRPIADKQPIRHAESLESIRLIRPAQQIACVTRSDGARWAGGVTRDTGALLSQGEALELVAGSAQVSMSCGADLVLQAPCRVVLADPMVVRLEKGVVTTEVAPWAQGFVVETSGMRVTDLGTRFAVSAESSSIAEVHVLEGTVIAEPFRTRVGASEGVRLNSGQAMRVNSARSQVERLSAERQRFIDRLTMFHPMRPIVMPNTGFGLAIGDDDPHWMITAGDGPANSWPIAAVVGPADSLYLDNFPDASQWISVPKGTTQGVLPGTTHTFETTFKLEDFDLSTVRLIGQFLADNGVTEIRLNGKPIDFVPWEERVGDFDLFQTFHVVRINEGFVEGENRLAVDVINTSWGGNRAKLPTPMGLRVEWQAFGRPRAPEAQPD